MPIIKNKTKQVICLTSKKGGTLAIEAGKTKPVPDEMWDDNKDMACVKAMLKTRQLLVVHQPMPAVSNVTVEVSDIPVDDDDDEQVDDENDDAPHPYPEFAILHHSKAKQLINDSSSLEQLRKMSEHETRPTVKFAFDERIAQLELEEEAVGQGDED